MEGKNHSHYGHRSRLRDRARNEGLENFQNYQVLEYALSFVIPYKDTNQLAHELINKFGSLSGVLEAREEDLMEVKGMGEASAHFLTSLIPIFGCYQKEKCCKTGVLNNPTLTYEHIKGCFVGKVVEEAYLVSLLPNNKVLKTEKLGEGTISNVKIAIRKITDAVSRNRVNKVILAHNHPFGVSAPSIDDDNFTKALMTTLAINDCDLIDHIIIGQNEGDYYSYRQTGRIDLFAIEVRKMIEGIQENPLKENIQLDNKQNSETNSIEKTINTNSVVQNKNSNANIVTNPYANTNTDATRNTNYINSESAQYNYSYPSVNDYCNSKVENANTVGTDNLTKECNYSDNYNYTNTNDLNSNSVTKNENDSLDEEKEKIKQLMTKTYTFDFDEYPTKQKHHTTKERRLSQPDNSITKANNYNIVDELKSMAGMTGDKWNDKK